MERLTQRQEYDVCDFMDSGMDVPMNKLRKLEDLEEQNKLIKLQFKPCDKVYLIEEYIEKKGRKNVTVPRIEEYTVDNIVIGQAMIPIYNLCDNKNFGLMTEDGLYATREEAEKALEEMKNE